MTALFACREAGRSPKPGSKRGGSHQDAVAAPRLRQDQSARSLPRNNLSARNDRAEANQLRWHKPSDRHRQGDLFQQGHELTKALASAQAIQSRASKDLTANLQRNNLPAITASRRLGSRLGLAWRRRLNSQQRHQQTSQHPNQFSAHPTVSASAAATSDRQAPVSMPRPAPAVHSMRSHCWR